jgi:hypothetical protein
MILCPFIGAIDQKKLVFIKSWSAIGQSSGCYWKHSFLISGYNGFSINAVSTKGIWRTVGVWLAQGTRSLINHSID